MTRLSYRQLPAAGKHMQPSSAIDSTPHILQQQHPMHLQDSGVDAEDEQTCCMAVLADPQQQYLSHWPAYCCQIECEMGAQGAQARQMAVRLPTTQHSSMKPAPMENMKRAQAVWLNLRVQSCQHSCSGLRQSQRPSLVAHACQQPTDSILLASCHPMRPSQTHQDPCMHRSAQQPAHPP